MKMVYLIFLTLLLSLILVSGISGKKQVCPEVVSTKSEDGSRYGFMDEKGNIVTGYIYDDAEPFSDGMARVCRNGKCGYVNHEGREVIQTVYDFIGHFYTENCGLAVARVGDRYGFIKRNGDVAIPIVYDYCDSKFFDGRVRVMLHGKWGFLDQFGNDAVPLMYDGAEAFNDGLAFVVQDNEYFVIDISGNRIKTNNTDR